MFKFKSLLRSLALWFGIIAILSISPVFVSAADYVSSTAFKSCAGRTKRRPEKAYVSALERNRRIN